MRNALEKAVWHWYKAIRGPAGFSFSLFLLPTKNAYILPGVSKSKRFVL